MACKGFWECLLKLLNFLLVLVGFAMIGYGIYLFVEYNNAASADGDAALPPSGEKIVRFGRPMLSLELGLAAFIFFDKSWKQEIPTDKTGNFDMIYEFLEGHWKIIKWVALGVVIVEALIFLLALVVRAANSPADYDSDEEYIGGPRQQIRQPLINRPAAPATGVPVTGTLDHRQSRNDAWSTRMREKVKTFITF
ncbi:tobamovirus multiplication 2A [Striga asiatica]|uniref:Tobamovirus multiplication 2A n=1 Tax=Striga asiatica TaxID=4170 RepID=A0A5A7QZV1_STRAF|nr:tobamovirus multiplication 2A [Striga asiatica]